MLSSYYFVESKIHQMNVLAKIICLILFLTTIFLTNNLKYNILLIVLLTLLLLSSNVPIKIYLNSVLKIKLLLLIILIINYLLKVDLYVTLIIILRIIYIILYIDLLILTTTFKQLIYGIETILKPLKLIGINVKKIALAMTIIFRFIPTMINEKNKIMKAKASRGNYKKERLFSHSFKKIDNFVLNLELKQYDFFEKSINYNKFKTYDVFLLLIHLSILILVVKEVYL